MHHLLAGESVFFGFCIKLCCCADAAVRSSVIASCCREVGHDIGDGGCPPSTADAAVSVSLHEVWLTGSPAGHMSFTLTYFLMLFILRCLSINRQVDTILVLNHWLSETHTIWYRAQKTFSMWCIRHPCFLSSSPRKMLVLCLSVPSREMVLAINYVPCYQVLKKERSICQNCVSRWPPTLRRMESE